MPHVFGVTISKGGQGKSTTVSTLARLCAVYGARVLVVDLAQPGTTSASLRDIWPDGEHGSLSNLLLACRQVPAGQAPAEAGVVQILSEASLPCALRSQPSWGGGTIHVLPWDELLADAASFLQSEAVLRSIILAAAREADLVVLDYPAEGGPLMTNALMATDTVLLPLVPETPALEGADATLRMLARVREAGHPIALGGILLTRCEPRSKRTADIVQTLRQAGEHEGEPLSSKVFPFAIRANEFYEQAFRYGEPIWERSSNPAHWASYVLLTEWVLRRAGLEQLLTGPRRGPAQLHAETRIFDITGLPLEEADVPLSDFATAHGLRRS